MVRSDEFTARYADLLTGSYDCVDRIVLNAYYPLGHNPGGFRVWWRRWHDDGDETLDNAHLMRLAGRFARRVKAWGSAHDVPVVFCKAGERKHRIAEDYLAEHTVGVGVFLVLVARAPATVWKVNRSPSSGLISNLEKTRQLVNHYSFHVMDPTWGHLTIKMSGHPPFGAQIILNGHEHLACTAQAAGLGFTKEGNCFTRIDDPERLAQVADTLSQPGTVGRLSQVLDRWIYSACLCFGLDLADQQRSGFGYAYSIYQVEYSRNLIFSSGAVMERAFDAIVDRTRTRIDVPRLRTLFGVGHQQAAHPRRNGRRARAGCLARRVHRRRSRRESPVTDRAKRTRLHDPASRLRPAQTARQTPGGQTRADPPLPGPRSGSPDHRSPTHLARSGHRPNPRRHPPTRTRPTTHNAHPHRPRLRTSSRGHAHPLPRPPDRHSGINNKLSIPSRSGRPPHPEERSRVA